mmetsp:Transcript_53134/g.137259  ORF Transcript_53134/g.137259 Transcript_53134/m.137259 type:complete len:207 (-) Transcript_53134:353-973(-)
MLPRLDIPLHVAQVLLLTPVDSPGPHDAGPADEAPGREAEVQHGIGPDQGRRSPQAGAAVHGVVAPTGLDQLQEVQHNVHRWAPTVLEGHVHVPDAQFLEGVRLVAKQAPPFALFLALRGVALDNHADSMSLEVRREERRRADRQPILVLRLGPRAGKSQRLPWEEPAHIPMLWPQHRGVVLHAECPVVQPAEVARVSQAAQHVKH